MIGAKPGQVVIILGAGDPELAAEVALVTGLNGHTTVVDRGDEARHRIEAAGARAGALIEFVDAPLGMLPVDSESADLVVLHAQLAAKNPQARGDIVREAARIVRSGQRVVMIEGAKRGGVWGLLPAPPAALDESTGRAMLSAAGLTAARRLADVEGIAFFEARRRAE